MNATVADELALDRLLDSLSDLDRASVVRALKSRGYGTGFTSYHVHEARSEGYQQGLAAGRSEKKPAA